MDSVAGQIIDWAVVGKLKDWIAQMKRRREDVDLDTNLIAAGVLDSLEMVNFLLYIEELRGAEIPEHLIQPNNFTSLRIIHDVFLRTDENSDQN